MSYQEAIRHEKALDRVMEWGYEIIVVKADGVHGDIPVKRGNIILFRMGSLVAVFTGPCVELVRAMGFDQQDTDVAEWVIKYLDDLTTRVLAY